MLEPGSKVRFVIQAGENQYGHTWLLKTKKKTGDIYLENSSGKNFAHISIHDSGEWHYSIKHPSGSKKRKIYLGVSQSRNHIIPGWYHATRIVVGKKDAVFQNAKKSAIGVPFHPDYEFVAVDLFLCETEAMNLQIENAFLIANMRLGNGNLAVLFATPMKLNENPQEAFPDIFSDAVKVLTNKVNTGEPQSIVVMCDVEENFGYLMQVEMRIF